jgi:glutamine cyclotransferase
MNSSPPPSTPPPAALPVLVPEVLSAIPHDTSAFTQGLCLYNGVLYESVGEYALSSLRRLDRKTGNVLQKLSLPSEYFAEGMVVLDDKIYQLTWREQTCFVYDAATFNKLRTFSYFGEGWGLTTDGTMLIMSDGSNILRFLDPKDFSVKRTLAVTAPMLPSAHSIGGAAVPVNHLNELEMVNGEIWANIWFSDSVACINPATGAVTRWIDMRALGSAADRRSFNHVLNGMAYDPKRGVLLVTGKMWATMYEVKIPLQ